MSTLKKGLQQILKTVSSKHWLEQVIDDVLFKKGSEDRSGSEFHASWAGNCPRLIQFVMNGIIKDGVEPRLSRIFDVGKSANIRYKEYFEQAGILIGDEVPIRISIEGIEIVGRADYVIRDDFNNKYILELKTINTKGFDNLIFSGMYIENHFLQWNIYSKGLDIKNGIILYEDKNDQRIKIFSVEYNDKKFQETLGIFKMIDEYNKKGLLVPKPEVCTDPRFCSALNICKKN